MNLNQTLNVGRRCCSTIILESLVFYARTRFVTRKTCSSHVGPILSRTWMYVRRPPLDVGTNEPSGSSVAACVTVGLYRANDRQDVGRKLRRRRPPDSTVVCRRLGWCDSWRASLRCRRAGLEQLCKRISFHATAGANLFALRAAALRGANHTRRRVLWPPRRRKGRLSCSYNTSTFRQLSRLNH
jgi:hypothetical protein